MMLYCPTCGQLADQSFEVPQTEPFTSTNPMAGLIIWGPYSAEKTIVCQGRTWVHFRFDCENRLVELGSKLTEAYGNDLGYIDFVEEDEEDMFYGNNDDDDYEGYYDEDEGDDDMPF